MIRVPFRPITVRSAVPFRKLSYCCKIRNEMQSFHSDVPEIIPTQVLVGWYNFRNETERLRLIPDFTGIIYGMEWRNAL